jgi:hypothetical protein
MVGRRLDNRGARWKKQSQEDSVITSKGWLYGIEKSARGIYRCNSFSKPGDKCGNNDISQQKFQEGDK